jgi:hypothetical protein
MKRHILVAGLVLALLVTGAFAGPPPPTARSENLRVSSHDVTLNGDCSFPMEIDAFADGVIHRHYDATGQLVKTLITTPQGRMTFKNLNTGKSVWTPTVGVFVSKTNPDGSLTFGWSGIHARIVVPGQGLVLADLGRVEWTLKFDGSGNVTSFKLSRSGVQDGVVPARLCDVLD